MAVRPQRILPFDCAWFALLLLSSSGLGVACCTDGAASHNAARRASIPSSTHDDEPLAGLPEPARRGETFRRGVVLGPLVAPDDEGAFRKQYQRELDEALAVGATDVTLLVRWMQPDIRAIECAPYDSVHDDVLTWVIDQAKRRKLRVVLSPELRVESDEGEPAQRALKPSSWERWWWSYRRLALHYARVSSMRKVSMLTIGSELTSTEGQTDRWRALIKDVRKIYKGKISYVASADSFDKIAFWDALDVMSIAVHQGDPQSEAQLLDRLAPLQKQLERTSSARALGYQIVETSCGEGEAGESALLCRRALYKSFGAASNLEGVFVRSLGQPASRTKLTKASSSSEVVRHWYRGSKG